jgi:hypothetical protein
MSKDKPEVQDKESRGRGREKTKKIEVLSQQKFQTSKINCVGNFIKPKPSIHFIGADPEAAPSEKPEKDRRGHNDCKRHRPGLARLISWCPVCVLWRTVYSRTWRCIHFLEIMLHNRQNNDTHAGVAPPCSSCVGPTEILPLRTNRRPNRWSYSFTIFYKKERGGPPQCRKATGWMDSLTRRLALCMWYTCDSKVARR